MQVNFTGIFTGSISILPLILIFAFMPYLTRRDICFGIRIPTARWDDEYLKKLRRNHSLIVSAFGILALLIIAFFIGKMDESKSVWLISGLTFSYIAIYAIIYIVSWQFTKKYKEKMNWSVEAINIALADTKKSIKTRSLNPLWYLLYLLVIVSTYFASLSWYKTAPDMLPLQYDLNGNVTNTVPKDMSVVHQFIMIQILMLIIFFGINLLMGKAKETYDPSNLKVSIIQNKKMKQCWSKYLYIMGLIMLLLFTFAIYSILNPINPSIIIIVPIVFTIIIVAGALFLAIKTGQSGSHIKTGKTKINEKINRDDDKYWKLGSLYFNPDDPAIFVEKRFGIGWTNNWARWQSWVVIIVVFGLIAFSVIKSFN